MGGADPGLGVGEVAHHGRPPLVPRNELHARRERQPPIHRHDVADDHPRPREARAAPGTWRSAPCRARLCRPGAKRDVSRTARFGVDETKRRRNTLMPAHSLISCPAHAPRPASPGPRRRTGDRPALRPRPRRGRERPARRRGLRLVTRVAFGALGPHPAGCAENERLLAEELAAVGAADAVARTHAAFGPLNAASKRRAPTGRSGRCRGPARRQRFRLLVGLLSAYDLICRWAYGLTCRSGGGGIMASAAPVG